MRMNRTPTEPRNRPIDITARISYFIGVNWPSRGRSFVVVCNLLLAGLFSIPAQADLIRLRNRVIDTAAPATAEASRLAASAAALPPKLILVQFRAPLGETQREVLARAGVNLLRFIPDNAFLVRSESLSLADIRRLPFVAWAGPYEAGYKVHSDLRSLEIQNALTTATNSAAAAAGLEVSIVLAPGTRPAELANLKRLLGRVDQETSLRFGAILRGRLQPGQLDALLGSDAVLWVEPGPKMKLFDEVASKLVAGDGGPNELLSRSLGYDGAGVTISVADSGLNNGDSETMHPDLFGRTTAFFQYGLLADAADEHSHGTHVAGIVAGNGATGETDESGALYGLGVAPGASLVTQRIFDAVGGYHPPPSSEKLTRDALRAGAVIGSNSWGDDTQGRYDSSAMEFDELVRDGDALTLGNQQYILEFSAGNAGPGTRTIGSPAVAKNVIATGASGNDRPDFIIYADGPEAIAEFSSRGPCEDGRIKPDVVAPGTWIASLQSASATDAYAWTPISPNYQYQGGTSQAGPHVSGAAAVFVQFYRENFGATPSPALVKAALINSAWDLDDSYGTAAVPNMDEGWGAVDLPALLDPAFRLLFIEQTNLLSTGQAVVQRVVTTTTEEPLKITLTYTDVPGFPGAIPALVNDLDLEVVAPDGTLYRGNQFENGHSLPNPLAGDRINNVEGVYLPSPMVGEYQIRIRAARVTEDARIDTPGIDQDFALVCSGPLARPGDSAVAFDRRAYRAPDQLRLTVVDSDAPNPVNVTVTSTSETAGEEVALSPAGAGVFSGIIPTATGPASADGRLQVAHGDTVSVRYQDVSSSKDLMATARIDLNPPVLSQAQWTNLFGRVVIEWNTDEPADSTLVFGAVQTALTNLVRDATLTNHHVLNLAGLEPGATYYFLVSSRDEAGNSATNSNNGALYSFSVAAGRPLLLIDEYQDPFFDVPPISGYTEALDQTGVSYDFWDVAQQGEPSADVLRAYRAVIWRVPELVGVWSETERAALRQYIGGGGALFVASMELLSRLESAGDSDFIHNVLQVASYTVDPDSTGASFIEGSDFSPVAQGFAPNMDYTVYENAWAGLLGPDISDTFVPNPTATAMFLNDAGDVVGLHWAGTNNARVIFLSFPLDAVAMTPEANDRSELMGRALAFLLPDLGEGTLWLNSQSYSLPARVEVRLARAELADQGTAIVTATSDTDPNGVSVTLYESARRGFYQGYLELVPSTNFISGAQLKAVEGDTILVRYETAGGDLLTASATVDTTPPTIQDVVAQPDYVEATINWTTSEPSDALVQFGESTLLGRTAYTPQPATSHILTLSGLSPDRTYYFRVVSRDLAGNTTTDDNHGQLYSLRTLRPLMSPWSDNLDSGATDWTTIEAEESQTGWQLGTPHNPLVDAALSPPNAWSTSLNGEPRDFVETFLVSPAVFLTNGNVATLTFSHIYDFPDLTGFDIEIAELLVVPDNGAPITLGQFGDASGDWAQEEFDLTPYMGRMVYLAWHYLLFSMESVSRPGWTVDDVAISVSSVTPGRVEITNNIPLAEFILNGPVSRRGTGTSLLVTNAPPGQYVIEYADVPNYLTPATQTNHLSAGGLIVFSGVYIPATIDPDTDGDGLSDSAEAIAGTDPSNPGSVFAVTSTETTSGPALSCGSVAGRSYRLVTSSDGVNWRAETEWVPANASGPLVFPVPTFTNAGSYLFRVEVRKN